MDFFGEPRGGSTLNLVTDRDARPAQHRQLKPARSVWPHHDGRCSLVKRRGVHVLSARHACARCGGPASLCRCQDPNCLFGQARSLFRTRQWTCLKRQEGFARRRHDEEGEHTRRPLSSFLFSSSPSLAHTCAATAIVHTLSYRTRSTRSTRSTRCIRFAHRAGLARGHGVARPGNNTTHLPALQVAARKSRRPVWCFHTAPEESRNSNGTTRIFINWLFVDCCKLPD